MVFLRYSKIQKQNKLMFRKNNTFTGQNVCIINAVIAMRQRSRPLFRYLLSWKYISDEYNIYDAVTVFELAWATSSLRRLLDTYDRSIAVTSNKPISFVSLHMYTLICLSMNRKRIEIPENLFPILFRAYNRSIRITNIDLGLTQIRIDAEQFSLDSISINKWRTRARARDW